MTDDILKNVVGPAYAAFFGFTSIAYTMGILKMGPVASMIIAAILASGFVFMWVWALAGDDIGEADG